MSTVAFIGLGQMGKPMAFNLLKGKQTLRVYDCNPTAMHELTEQGAFACDSPAEAAKGADIVITMLPNGDLVKEVLLGDQGVCSTLNDQALVIDMSTIHPLQSDELNKLMTQLGFSYMDAPVGRTSEHAVAGTLLILAGGDQSQIEKAKPILMLMGNELIEAGGPGMGIRVKLINNYMSIALNALSAETASLCEGLGLSFDVALKVMQGTPAGNGHFTTTWPNKVLSGDVSPVFMLDLAHKDLGIAMDVANQLHITMPMGAAARELYSQARAAGRGKQDWTAILDQVRAASGLTSSESTK